MNEKTLYDFRNYNEYLLYVLKEKQKKNKNYSLRTFATFLEISKTALSETFNEKRNLSKKSLIKIAAKLKFKKQDLKYFLSMKGPIPSKDPIDDYMTIKEDEFKLMSDWYYIGIICVAQMPDNKADTGWLAKRLGIKVSEAEAAINILIRLRLIEIANGQLIRTTNPIAFHSPIPSQLVRDYHRQNLKLAEEKLDSLQMNERLFSSISIPSSKAKLEKAKKHIERFKKQMINLMSTDKQEEVYTIAVQVFPITK